MANEKTIWTYLMGKIGNACGVAGLMGNLYAESGLVPNNLQNSYNTKLGYTDAAYTAAVDDGSYTNFVKDSAGYGLAQWTYYTRKQKLKDYADAQKASIGDLDMQLGFLYKELSESYSSVLKVLKNATSVLEASNAVLLKYEKPANSGTSVQTKRAEYGQKYYDAYAGTSSSSTTTAATSDYAVGDIIQFAGGSHYKSASATSGTAVKAGPAKITKVSSGAKHPYHIVHTDSTSTVYGWVDASTISADSTSAATTTSSSVTEKKATDAAKSYLATLAGTYKTTANLHMRNGAGTGKTSMVVLPKGTSVKNYGYYTTASGVKWLYVQVTYKSVKYTGFCSGTYLQKS